MRALSIRQPYAELILRGIKPIEFRSRRTSIVGERFYIYASKQWAAGELYLAGCRAESERRIVGDNIESGGAGPATWMMELAKMLIAKDLPTGVIVGSAVIEKVEQNGDELFAWHLTDVARAKKLRKPKGQPQPVWFRPF